MRLEARGYRYSDIFGMHTLGAAFARITEVTGMPIHDTRNLSGHGADSLKMLIDSCYADTPLAELARMRGRGYAPANAARYDSALMQEVAHLYEEDLGLYQISSGRGGINVLGGMQ